MDKSLFPMSDDDDTPLFAQVLWRTGCCHALAVCLTDVLSSPSIQKDETLFSDDDDSIIPKKESRIEKVKNRKAKVFYFGRVCLMNFAYLN